MALGVTEPPQRHWGHEWHWLWSESADSPLLCRWRGALWYICSPGGDGMILISPITPQQMYRRGWQWLQRAKVPRLTTEVVYGRRSA